MGLGLGLGGGTGGLNPMRPLPSLLLGILLGVALTWAWNHSFQPGTDSIDSLLGLSDSELLAKSSEIERLRGEEGKALQALLACVGFRVEARSAGFVPQNGRPAKGETDSAAAKKTQPSPRPNSADGENPRPRPQTGAENAGTSAQAFSPLPSPAPSSEVGTSGGRRFGTGNESGATSPSSSGSSGREAPSGFDWRHFFCTQVRDMPLPLTPDAKWKNLFPLPAPESSPVPSSGSYGWLESSGDPKEILEHKTCTAPRLRDPGAGARDREKFFKNLRGKVFEGIFQLPTPTTRDWVKLPRRLHVHFNRNASDENQEYFFVYQYDGKKPEDLFENRYVTYKTKDHSLSDTVYRLNDCSQALTVLGETCPWGKAGEYDLEYKDLFYLAAEEQLAGNVYCRRKQNQAWVKVTSFNLSLSSGQ